MKRIALTLAVLTAVCALLCACGKAKAKAKPISEIWSQIKNEVTFEDFSEYDDVAKLNRNYGITEDMVAEFAGGKNGSGVNQEEIVLIKATNEENAEAVRQSLETKFQSKLNQNKNYNAEQAKMIEGCKVEKNGLYVTMIVSDNAEQITGIFKKGAAL